MASPSDKLANGSETYSAKNEDYGDSWQKIGHILYLLAGEEEITLSTPEDHISYGLFTRRLDKLARAYHGEFVGDGDPNNEPILDAHEDEMVYAAMHSSIYESRGNRPDGDENREEDSGDEELFGVSRPDPAQAGEVQPEPSSE